MNIFLSILNWFLTPAGTIVAGFVGGFILICFIMLVVADIAAKRQENARITRNIMLDVSYASKEDVLRAYVDEPLSNIPSDDMETDIARLNDFMFRNFGSSEWTRGPGMRLVTRIVESAHFNRIVQNS